MAAQLLSFRQSKLDLFDAVGTFLYALNLQDEKHTRSYCNITYKNIKKKIKSSTFEPGPIRMFSPKYMHTERRQ